MVVVQVRYAKHRAWHRAVFETSFWIGSDPSCALRLEHAKPRHVQIVIDGPDVRLEPHAHVQLDGLPVDRTFLHVLHVGNVLEVQGHLIAFELVDGLAADIERYISGTGKHVLDDIELGFVDALRADPDDAETLDVYADWLDQHDRPLLAEQIRLQRLRDSTSPPDHPSTFQSKWLSAQPAAVALRLRDLAPLAEPWWRALVARRPIIGCINRTICPRWQGLAPTDTADLRRCTTCDREVYFCWSRDEIRARGRRRDLIAVDPGLAIHDPQASYYDPEREPAEEVTGERLAIDEDT